MPAGDYEAIRAVAADADEELSAAQVLSALALLRALRQELAGWEPHLIAAARELGTSWAELAPALGVASRQAAERRYLRLRPSELGTTGDERVQAERDKRASERAVSQWARENSAALRSLAGQVGVLDMRVRDALADDDAAALLQPLAQAQEQLRATHPALAEQIARVTERTDQIRRVTLTQRAGNC
ncbi:MAG: hypothetical protein LC799_34245 [Actinobacteria bacterium]|nr:hypothetical protein [Actinomycetota bacterium]